MRWAELAWLVLLVLAVLPWWAERVGPRLAWPTLSGFGRRGARGGGRWVAPLLRSLAIACLAVALARPQTVAGRTRVAGRGLAIALVLDRSSSMTASDAEPEGQGPPVARLEAALRTLGAFVEGRPDDLIGLVVFANYPDLACPPTLDHETLRAAIAAVRPARGVADGTNIGDALAWACDALRETGSIRQVVVLLSDGANEPQVPAPPAPQPLDPVEAAEIARGLGITVHTIAVGGAGGLVRRTEPTTGLPVPILADGPDVDLLARLAKVGGGRAFRAETPDALERVFAELDTLERSPISGYVRTRYRERFGPLAIAALVLLGLDRLVAASRRSRLP